MTIVDGFKTRTPLVTDVAVKMASYTRLENEILKHFNITANPGPWAIVDNTEYYWLRVIRPVGPCPAAVVEIQMAEWPAKLISHGDYYAIKPAEFIVPDDAAYQANDHYALMAVRPDGWDQEIYALLDRAKEIPCPVGRRTSEEEYVDLIHRLNR